MVIEKEKLKAEILKNLKVSFGKELSEAKDFEIYRALGETIMQDIASDWYDTEKLYSQQKQAFYLSAEFLMGRALGNNLINLGILDEVKEIFKELGIDYNKVEDAEEDAALGNGGLGRLAACFLDSLATLNLPGQGYGIRYRNGIFNQEFKDGYQIEKPETWLKYGDVWSVMRPADEVIVTFGDGSVRALPYDMPIIGYGTRNINTLRLWEAHSLNDLDLGKFNQQDYLHATEDRTLSEDISRVLYPNDSTDEGKKLRLKQQYFFVSASLQDIVKKFKKQHGTDFSKFADYVAIQLNDTHPVIGIPELMRIFIDIEGLSWQDAWSIVERTFSYTNHTILAEALEKWWVGLFEQVVPRVYQITQGIDNQLRQILAQKFPNDPDRQNRMQIINGNMIHMAWLAIYGSSKVNGVAKLHTDILKTKELKDWYELYPEKFLNKTNGITQRRWLLESNPQLASYITELIGDGWITNLMELKKLEEFLDDEDVLRKILQIKHEKKVELAQYLYRTQNIIINPESIFDVQVKRLHAYKRQLMNILHVLCLYHEILDNVDIELDIQPRTFIFGAKAAPGYYLAKCIIKLINCVSNLVNNDPRVKDKIKVVFIENYGVSLAEKIIPAANVSEQISTTTKEASGTSNMKFMINGALTLATLDGANVEIYQQVGKENMFLFGLSAKQVLDYNKYGGYSSKDLYHSNKLLRRVVDDLVDGFIPGLGNEGREIYDALITYNDEYFVLRDLDEYAESQQRISNLYKDKMKWNKISLINIANSGIFSSDRTINEYIEDIWFKGCDENV